MIILNVDFETSDYLGDGLEDECATKSIDPKRLGFSEQREWHCSQCGEAYQNCINFARHLREHYHPRKVNDVSRKKTGHIRPKNFICQFCAAKFRQVNSATIVCCITFRI